MYRSPSAVNEGLEDNWSGMTGLGETFLPGGYAPAPVAFRPAGTETYQYLMSYGTLSATDQAKLNGQTTLRLRKIGQTLPFLTIQFTAANLALGEVRTIYTA